MSAQGANTEQLIEQCQGLVRSIARRIHMRLPRNVDLDDLIGYGQVGLLEAAKLYRPERGVKFSTFAYYRIRGAIYDGLTMMSWFRQSPHRQAHYDRLANDLLEADCEDQSASQNRTLKDDAFWLRDLSARLAIAYLTLAGPDDDAEKQRPIVDRRERSPSSTVSADEIHQRLRELVDSLPEQEARLIRAAYYEGLSLKEAAKRLGVSKSWASRLHARTLKRLARSLRQLGVVES
ncbi:MAG: sigma-70 family RNA polymerase sigma factor [Planctomycetes bacterium]|nr:sigma-70 family RNA polymerase sigma factor [Planctomycetota bacterium]